MKGWGGERSEEGRKDEDVELTCLFFLFLVVAEREGGWMGSTE